MKLTAARLLPIGQPDKNCTCGFLYEKCDWCRKELNEAKAKQVNLADNERTEAHAKGRTTRCDIQSLGAVLLQEKEKE